MNFSHGLGMPLLPTALTKMADLTSGSTTTSSVHCPFDSGPLVSVPASPEVVVGELDFCFDDYDVAMVAADARAATSAAVDVAIATAAAMATVSSLLG